MPYFRIGLAPELQKCGSILSCIFVLKFITKVKLKLKHLRSSFVIAYAIIEEASKYTVELLYLQVCTHF